MPDEVMDLGPCCICRRDDDTVRNLMLLPRRGEPGGGWGCFQCHLPMDGASAVICDACLKETSGAGVLVSRLQDVIAGYPAEKQRTPYADLPPEPFEHDLRYHPELWSTQGASLTALARSYGDEEWWESEDAPMPLLLFDKRPDGSVGMLNAGPVAEGWKDMQQAGYKWNTG